MWIECDAETLRGGREDEQARQSVVTDNNVGVLEDITDRNTENGIIKKDNDKSQ